MTLQPRSGIPYHNDGGILRHSLQWHRSNSCGKLSRTWCVFQPSTAIYLEFLLEVPSRRSLAGILLSSHLLGVIFPVFPRYVISPVPTAIDSVRLLSDVWVCNQISTRPDGGRFENIEMRRKLHALKMEKNAEISVGFRQSRLKI